jgi:hypothetical protein
VAAISWMFIAHNPRPWFGRCRPTSQFIFFGPILWRSSPCGRLSPHHQQPRGRHLKSARLSRSRWPRPAPRRCQGIRFGGANLIVWTRPVICLPARSNWALPSHQACRSGCSAYAGRRTALARHQATCPYLPHAHGRSADRSRTSRARQTMTTSVGSCRTPLFAMRVKVGLVNL